MQSAAGLTCLPLAASCIGTSYWRADRPRPEPGSATSSHVRPVTPAMFKTLEIPFLDGRDFSNADTADSQPVAIVSESLARQRYAGENPLGRRLRINVDHANGRDDMEWTIVGVVRDIRGSSLDSDPRATIHVPKTQVPVSGLAFVIRSEQDPMSLATSVRRTFQSIDPQVPVTNVRTLEDFAGSTIARPRAISVIVSVFALAALVLAHEIGVRMALGATEISVFRLVLTQALKLVLAGVAVGLGTAGTLTRLLEQLLYRIEPVDPWTFGTTAVVLLVIATLAAYVPARRGMRIPPVEALRAR